MPENKMEILSPAGCLATLKSAVNNGANAVYIGGRAFSARKNAVNFTDEEIVEGVRYAHMYGARVFVTVNTIISDGEFSQVYEFVKFLYNSDVDALIIQDLGVLRMVRECFPDFEVHASTQMTIHNLDGVLLARELGFERVVLSRELTFEEIRNISESTDTELEVFVHGALCMSYSGQCLMSSFLGARSGNRGACAQPCRLPYSLYDSNRNLVGQKNKYLLSLKDLCLADEMDTLRNCGVTSLKIEGRMKSSEYVSLVTSIYSRYRNGGQVSDEDYRALRSIFSRSGFTKGYLQGNTGRHMLNYDKNNDSVYNDIAPDVLLRARTLSEKDAERIPFDACVKICRGKPLMLSVTALGKTVSACGTIPAEEAINVSLDVERVEAQLSRTGSTLFVLNSLSADIEPGLSLPVKEINEVRRRALEILTEAISHIDRTGNIKECPLTPAAGHRRNTQPAFVAQVRTMAQAEAAIELGFDRIAAEYSLFAANKEFFEKHKDITAMILPPIMRDNRSFDKEIVPPVVYATNLSHFRTFGNREIIADFRMNIFNSFSAQQIASMGAKGICLSAEMNLRQISELASPVPTEIVVYGRIPLMTVQNCVVKSASGKCMCGDKPYYLKDRKDVLFPVYTDKLSCTDTIYNGAPVYMADRLDEICGKADCMRFVFTMETPDEMKEIFYKYCNREATDIDFTRGHYYRGV